MFEDFIEIVNNVLETIVENLKQRILICIKNIPLVIKNMVVNTFLEWSFIDNVLSYLVTDSFASI